MKKKILIIGSGGREHAIGWKISQSPKCGQIFFAPGNAGTAQLGTNVNIKATDVLALADFAEKNRVDFTVVGPDDSLALGVVDEFQKRNLKIWGASKGASQIEWSKAFSKKLMEDNNIPTAKYKTFTDYEEALKYTEQEGAPIVIKASGLALGKGVTICKTLNEAKKFLENVMVNKIFGDSGNQVVIEEFLEGQEFSAHAFCDGQNFKILPPSQDHKTIFDGDMGPNTGGMGTIAPLPWVSDTMINKVASDIVKPALEGLKNLGAPFVGLLYPGLMASFPPLIRRGIEGEVAVKTIEYNSRFGDPETQSYMRLLKTDLFDILNACVDGNLDEINIEWEKKFACCIVLASGGYPEKYEKGLPITGIEEASKLEDIVIFHAGTATSPALRAPSPHEGRDGERLLTNGGRVLGITATADTLQTALKKAYSAIKLIHFEGMHYRTDIGAKSLPPPPLP